MIVIRAMMTFHSAWAARFYLNFSGGDDHAAGSAPASAWKSLAKINAATFKAGARTIRGSPWSVLGESTASNPLPSPAPHSSKGGVDADFDRRIAEAIKSARIRTAAK